jgi:hypothetical protein
MTDSGYARTNLLVATLQRAGRPMTTAELRDEATGLARAEGWPGVHVAETLSRRSIAALMRNLARSGARVSEGPCGFDPDARRPTPTYRAVHPDAHAPIPPPPEDEDASEAATAAGMDTAQMLAVIDIGDEVCGAVQRFLRDVQDIQRRARQRLHDAGWERGA